MPRIQQPQTKPDLDVAEVRMVFAAIAMHGLVSGSHAPVRREDYSLEVDATATIAVRQAEALIAALGLK